MTAYVVAHVTESIWMVSVVVAVVVLVACITVGIVIWRRLRPIEIIGDNERMRLVDPVIIV